MSEMRLFTADPPLSAVLAFGCGTINICALNTWDGVGRVLGEVYLLRKTKLESNIVKSEGEKRWF